MNGGLAVIADVPKTMVYRISHWLNRKKTIIPPATITKAPSAELRPNQTDQDSLPEYDVLDAILDKHIMQHKSQEEIIADGLPADAVKRVVSLVRIAEFKRKQAAPGLKSYRSCVRNRLADADRAAMSFIRLLAVDQLTTNRYVACCGAFWQTMEVNLSNANS